MSERFTITVEAPPGDRPGVTRLRALLKALLRRYRLRCVEVQWEVGDDVGDVPRVPSGHLTRSDAKHGTFWGTQSVGETDAETQ